MKENPLVSIVMAVYNGASYLQEAINSILSQSYQNFEFLIINDGSTDESEDIIISYKDSRIEYIKNETNLGLIKSLNKGIALAKGVYILRMDADDISNPNRLQEQVSFMNQNLKVGVCGSFIQNIGKAKNTVSFYTEDAQIRFRLLLSTYIRHPSVIMRGSVIRDNELRYNQNYKHVEDHKLWVDFSKHSQLAIIPKFLLNYRVHNENISVVYKEDQANIETKIRMELLQKMGIKVNYQEMNLINSFYHLIRKESNPFILKPLPKSKEAMLQMVSLLNNIVLANRKSQFVSTDVLEYHFSKAYKELLPLLSGFGLHFMNKALNNVLGNSIKVQGKLKLMVKALFKKSYNYNQILYFPHSDTTN